MIVYFVLLVLLYFVAMSESLVNIIALGLIGHDFKKEVPKDSMDCSEDEAALQKDLDALLHPKTIPDFKLELVTLSTRWLDALRVARNRRSFGFKVDNSDSQYIAYIKSITNSKQALRLHFLYAAKLWHGDYFDAIEPLKHFKTFLNDFDKAMPVPVPPNMYLGKAIWFNRLPVYTVGQHIAELKSHVQQRDKDNFLRFWVSIPDGLRIYKGYHMSAGVVHFREPTSPFPGNNQDGPFNMRNPKDVFVGCKEIIVDCDMAHESEIEGAFKRDDIPIPPASPDTRQITEWLDRALFAFVKRVNSFGISWVG